MKTILLACVAALATASFTPRAIADDAKPLMVIRYNQENVYFGRTLKKAVAYAEQAKAGVIYKVVSLVPSGSKKGTVKVSADQAKKNLGGVTTMMQQLGVDDARIKADTQSSSAVKSQEIRIFVE